MNITICSALDAIRFLNNNKDENVISIMCEDDKQRLKDMYNMDIDLEYVGCENVLRLSFDDVDLQRENAPKMSHIKEAIEWAKDKKQITVHCFAGISRSSALAYVIACSQMPVDHALQVLNLKVHCPNETIIRLGSEALGNKKMLKKLEREEKKTLRKWMELK